MFAILCSVALLGAPETVAAVSVVDLQGRPIAGAKIRMRTIKQFGVGERDVLKGGFQLVPLEAAFAKTNDDGRWTSTPLPSGAAYVVEAKAPGYIGDFSRWIHPSESGRVELPPIKLRRLVTLTGNVRNRGGRPLAGVRVFTTGDGSALRECRTDAAGAFTLTEAPEGRLLVFADHADYYLTGALAEGKAPVALTLAPRSAPNPERMPPQPPAKPLALDAATLADAKRRTMENAKAVFAQKKDDHKSRTANLTAFQSPDEILRLVRSATYEQPYTREICLYMIAVSMDRKDSWEPQIIASEVGSNWRRNVLSSLQHREKDSARRYEYFARIALEARDIEDESTRMYALANLAESAGEAGFVKEAAALAEEAEQIAVRLPATSGNEGCFVTIAEAWATIDRDRLRRILPKVKGFRERLAATVARTDPALGANIYDDYCKTLSKPSAGHWISELAYYVAKSDLPRAERIADNVLTRTDRFAAVGSSEYPALPTVLGRNLDWRGSEGPAMWRGVLQGFLADARFQVGDHEGARQLLADAVRRLEAIKSEAWHTGGGFLWNRMSCLTVLMPIAERIDESLVSELFWKALASRPPLDEFDSNNLDSRDLAHAAAARLLARYRPDVARHLIEQVAIRTWRQSWRGEMGHWVPGAYFDVDPAAARRWCHSLCDLPTPFAIEKPAKSPRAERLSWPEPGQSKPDREPKPTLVGWRTILSTLWLERVVDKQVEREE